MHFLETIQNQTVRIDNLGALSEKGKKNVADYLKSLSFYSLFLLSLQKVMELIEYVMYD
jgi:hypothetical protein